MSFLRKDAGFKRDDNWRKGGRRIWIIQETTTRRESKLKALRVKDFGELEIKDYTLPYRGKERELRITIFWEGVIP